MTTNNEERARAWTNVYPDGSVLALYKSRETATLCRAEDAIRTAELVELPEGASIVTREMRERIDALHDSLCEQGSGAVFKVLDILDGKDGQ